MQEGGFRAKAGQGVRILDVRVTGRHGAFDELHGAAGGAEFAESIKHDAASNFGFAGPAFLERLTRDERDFRADLERIKALPQFGSVSDAGQVRRAAAKFALVALAGELASEYEVVPWPSGTATAAAAEGFRSWCAQRANSANSEAHDILERVSDFIDRHGDSRFTNVQHESPGVRDRAGWWRQEGDKRVFLILSEALHDATKGFDFRRALDALVSHNVLPPPKGNGERSKPEHIEGRSVRVYHIDSKALAVALGFPAPKKKEDGISVRPLRPQKY